MHSVGHDNATFKMNIGTYLSLHATSRCMTVHETPVSISGICEHEAEASHYAHVRARIARNEQNGRSLERYATFNKRFTTYVSRNSIVSNILVDPSPLPPPTPDINKNIFVLINHLNPIISYPSSPAVERLAWLAARLRIICQ